MTFVKLIPIQQAGANLGLTRAELLDLAATGHLSIYSSGSEALQRLWASAQEITAKREEIRALIHQRDGFRLRGVTRPAR